MNTECSKPRGAARCRAWRRLRPSWNSEFSIDVVCDGADVHIRGRIEAKVRVARREAYARWRTGMLRLILLAGRALPNLSHRRAWRKSETCILHAASEGSRTRGRLEQEYLVWLRR
jgi:hypothetical protein